MASDEISSNVFIDASFVGVEVLIYDKLDHDRSIREYLSLYVFDG
jgi:hypothetical protein